ncbi:MAG: hypothetical protein J7639_10985 [Paenibacillaceae bacterium]|nr:hypothetical protein [Paenibacillaceae bacterium]
MTKWKCALELNRGRERVSGSEAALCDAIRGGADLRIETSFRHHEHIDTQSDNRELVREVSEFRATYMIDDRWAAGFMTLRQPVDIPRGFASRPSLSLFLYNQDGQQAIARPYLDGVAPPRADARGASPQFAHLEMPNYHQLDSWDAESNAPSSNFNYDFDVYRYWVNEAWQEVYAHDADGRAVRGTLAALVDAFQSGCEVKVGLRGVCADPELADERGMPELADDRDMSELEHEVFVQVGFTYYYTESKLFLGETHPIVRVRPSVPLRYRSGNWDYGWLMPRTDGYADMLLLDPYTLRYRRKNGRFAMRWFVK